VVFQLSGVAVDLLGFKPACRKRLRGSRCSSGKPDEIAQPCRCLWRGFSQMTMTRP
jgi:hypothetical protein